MNRSEELLERMATALEKLAEDPVVEIESGPPICPHCQTFNPTIEINEIAGTGPLLSYYVPAICENCNNVIYIVPLQYAIFTDQEEVNKEISDREAMLNGDGRKNG